MDVLIVEDEKPLRESLLDGLTSAFSELEVHAVGSAEDAASMLGSAGARLVISDVRLPGKDGVALLLDVRERWPDTAFVFMSAYPSPDARSHAADRGIRFLRKPFEFGELVSAVESALEPDQDQFSGKLGGISLVDLLQVLNMGRRTAAVTLERAGRRGRIYLRDGEVVHAEAGRIRGRAAFDELMAWKGGRFGSEPGCEAPSVTIEEPFNALLLDVFREQDERERDAGAEDLLSFDGVADAGEAGGEAEESKDRLEEALRVLPGCLAAFAVDVGSGAILGAQGAAPEGAADLVADMTRAFMRSAALAELDAALSRRRSGAADAVKEVIAVSPGLIHVLQRVGSEGSEVVIATCPATANLGSVVAKARAWRRGLDRGAGRD